MQKFRDNIERWLVHGNFKFIETKPPENSFNFSLKPIGSFGIPIEIFEPQKQPGIIVLGGKIKLKNNQNSRFLKLTEKEQENFKDSVVDFCNSIRAICKFSFENGVLVISVFLVLDKVETFTQSIIHEAIVQTNEMSEKTNSFILKTF